MSLMHISLKQLRAFIATVDAGSFTRAAERLHLTQSAVSMVIRQLESEIGLPLFNREGKQISLTDMGHQLVPIARRMLDDLALITASAADIQGLQRGALRFSAPSPLISALSSPALAAFSETHPAIPVQIVDTTLDDVPEAVSRGAVEFGIGPDRPPSAGVERTYLRSIDIQFVCPVNHPAARRRQLRWSETRDYAWIYYRSNFEEDVRNALWRHGRAQRIEDSIMVEQLSTALALVSHGLGVTSAPDYAQALHSGGMKLRYIPLVEPGIRRAFYVYHRHGRELSPVARAFLKLLAP